ncbi:50S ribosomal protein L18 [Alphaproteobacteria bacterium]|jgi:large subunit ribosomal protein L18|nr:50S ribosomal protein L18 [Alphaproteobacteria bacterium]|tara:strand:+ start:82 stop:450 length:369 start_codon:yes stop_codon:yes gene_type:complete
MSAKSKLLLTKRKLRNRFKLKSNSTVDLRLTVFRSNTNFYSQIVDDKKGTTLVAASTLEKDIKAKIKNKGGNKSAAELVGTELAKRADKKGIKSVFFDRGGYLYHGRVKVFAEAVRKEGLKF